MSDIEEEPESLGIFLLENRFSSFPDSFDFGDFQILNPTNFGANLSSRTRQYLEILQTLVGEKNLCSPYPPIRIAKSGQFSADERQNYFLNRPQIVFGIGGGESSVWPQLAHQSRELRMLLDLCGTLYDFALLREGDNNFSGDDVLAPQPLQIGIGSHTDAIEMLPPYGMTINKRTGNMHFYTFSRAHGYELVSRSHFKNQDCPKPNYDVEKFRAMWGLPGSYCIALRRWGRAGGNKNQKFSEAIERAACLIAQCKDAFYHHKVDVTLNAVIAMETLLNPFGEKRTEITERFALFLSRLASGDRDEERVKLYSTAKALYGYRSRGAHSGMTLSFGQRFKGSANEAIRLFDKCLQQIMYWAVKKIEKDEKIDEASFQQLYEEIVVENKPPPLERLR